jgi:hypothetical protein
MVNATSRRACAARAALFVVLPVFVSCVSTSVRDPIPVQPAPASPETSVTPGPAVAPPSLAISEIDDLLAKARDAADSNHLAEAIRAYISVIAIHEEGASSATKDKAEEAAAALARIGGRLSLEPAGDWIDEKGAQVAALSRPAGKDGIKAPSVYLFENFGAGKSPVPDAPVFFEFSRNSGSIIQLVTTDAYGKANTTVARIDQPGKEAVIRAYPLFRARGKTYAFKTVFRDFAYLPPSNVARVLVLESSELGASDNPQVVDSAMAVLKSTGLQFAPYNGKLSPEAFRLAFGGDTSALAVLRGESGESAASYVAFVLVEAAEIRQMELNGKKYNIYTCVVNTTFRLVRSDGTAVFALPLDPVKGQGGTREAAVSDGYRRARDALSPALQASLTAIRDALAKE